MFLTSPRGVPTPSRAQCRPTSSSDGRTDLPGTPGGVEDREDPGDLFPLDGRRGRRSSMDGVVTRSLSVVGGLSQRRFFVGEVRVRFVSGTVKENVRLLTETETDRVPGVGTQSFHRRPPPMKRFYRGRITSGGEKEGGTST